MPQAVGKSPLNVLLVAEHASSTFGGEALIPYQYFKCLRELGIDVHLLVHERTKPELFGAFPNEIERLHFVADSAVNIWFSRITGLLPDRLGAFTLGAVSHWETQVRQRRAARSLVTKYHFDIVHEPIPVSPKLPSMMFGLSVPVIIGPMNGGMDYPPNYDLAGSFERAIISALRGTSGFWNRILPGKKQAALLLVANKRTYEALPSMLQQKWVLELVENGVDLDRFQVHSAIRERTKLSIIYLGRLVDWKRVDLLIAACSKLLGKINLQLEIAGEGSERDALEKQVQRASLTSHVHFHGWLPQTAAAELLRVSDLMVLPSMRECGGAAVLEAMASGVPVIAANWGGPADYIDGNTGILVAPGTPDSFVEALADAILWMAQNPELRIKMGQAGRQRVKSLYDWRMKATALVKIYKDVLNADRRH
jgi:glycosyltransferase involved in cell wall biosynthesis